MEFKYRCLSKGYMLRRIGKVKCADEQGNTHLCFHTEKGRRRGGRCRWLTKIE